MTDEIEQILDYWYGPTREYFYADKARLALWFRGDENTNKDIQKRFLNIHQRAARSELSHWLESKDGVLALIIILDQFSRNIYKGSANAFSCDPLALTIVTRVIELEDDLSYQPLQKLFLYLPLEHSEDLNTQWLCIEKYKQLSIEAPDYCKQQYAHFLDYARQHYDIIQRFGRFPHRNQILNRNSSDEEIEFLKQPGSSF